MTERLLLWLAVRLWHVMLCVCPRDFRREYGAEMTLLYRARCERALTTGGAPRLIACAAAACGDLVTGAIADRIRPPRPRARLSLDSYPPLRGDSMWTRLLFDLRIACRSFAHQPLFSLTVIATLAVGIGATATMFGIVDGAVLRPLRYEQAGRLVSLVNKDARFGAVPFAPPYLQDLRERVQSLESIAAFSPSWQHALTGSGEARVVTSAFVSDGLFDLLGIAPVQGRAFDPSEYAPGGPAVAVVSEMFWARQFGAAPYREEIIRLDGTAYTIVGLLPGDFRMPITGSTVARTTTSAEIWIPFARNPYAMVRSIPVLNVIGRLRDGVTPDAAQQEMAALAAGLARDYPATSGGAELQAIPLRELVTRDVRTPLLVLFGAVGALLAIACANVGHMLLARAAGREGEMALRSSLGATRGRLASQLLVESAVLASIGAAAGLGLAWLALRAVPSIGFPGLPPSARIGFDWRVAALAAAAALLTTVLAGIVPAIHASRRAPFGLLKDGARTTGARARRMRNALVFAEVTLAVVLLVGAGLLGRSFLALTSVDPGFAADRVLAGAVSLPAVKYGTAASRLAFADNVLARVSALPGVEAAALVNRLPFGGGNVLVGVEIEGRVDPGAPPATMDRRVVTPGYFAAMGIPVVDGQEFGIEHRTDSPDRVAIVNQAVARRYWPDGHAIGGRLRLMLRGGPGPWLRVIGIAGNVRHHGLDQPAQPEVYVPYTQAAVESFVVLVRTTADPLALAPSLRGEVRRLDPDLPVDRVGVASAGIRESVAEPRLRATLLNAFAALALALAAMGVYGVVSFSVATSTRDIGVRLALGAQRTDILRMVLRQGLWLVGAGAATGLAISLFASRLLARLLFGISPTDPLTFALAATVLLVVALVASYLPARRAMRLDPVNALRVGAGLS